MDSWVADAISDTYAVAKFLMELSQSNRGKSKVAPQPLQGFRRKRSRMITLDVIKESKKEESRPRRASPTTPLSWTDGSSTSSAGESIGMLQGFRRKRSRMITLDVIKESTKEESRPRRASPTTPLSWTDGSSTSSAGESIGMLQARMELLSRNRKRKSNSKVDITQNKKMKFTIKAGKTKKNDADSQEELNNIDMHKIFFRVPDLNLPPESED